MTPIDESRLLSAIETALAALPYPAVAPTLYTPVKYTLEEGGKRLRPLLTLATAIAAGGSAEGALNQALAVEMFHNFTLIHDDVMDRSDRRRGRPTVFRRWGEVQAILSGDALLTLATVQLAKGAGAHLAEALELFDRTALEVYEGQQLDIEFETRRRVCVAEYMEMIRLKTSVLLGCACEMGAIMGGADEQTRRAIYDYAENVGVAFQLRDDWLDTFGDPEVFGKPIGGDIVNGKKTWLHLNAVKADPEGMAAALACRTRAGKVSRVKAVYERLGLSEKCSALIDTYVAAATEALSQTGFADGHKQWFADLASRLCKREK